MSRSNRYCSVPQCSFGEKKSNINFHAFPQAGDEYRVWVEGTLGSKVLMDRQKAWQLKLKLGKPVTRNMKVCSLDFIDDDYFYRDSSFKQRKFLKNTAVPSRNLPVGSTTTKEQLECSSSRTERLRQSLNEEKLVAEECSCE
ncbi:hypothetical protein JTB14_024240 [Gonioctena quinquepunctata]|nr:hypothetical protein JTB14_024240 [Gonioctena quinquepunctata]